MQLPQQAPEAGAPGPSPHSQVPSGAMPTAAYSASQSSTPGGMPMLLSVGQHMAAVPSSAPLVASTSMETPVGPSAPGLPGSTASNSSQYPMYQDPMAALPPQLGMFGFGPTPVLLGQTPYYFPTLQPPPGVAAAAAHAALASPSRGRPPGGRSRGAAPAASGKKHCNCKNSRCLKLYCECFASGRYCDGCNCVNCCNNAQYESTRQTAIESILERNPNAFRPKIAGDVTDQGSKLGAARHNKGCNCKKSGCLKKYCECFQAGIFCSDNCKCIDCKNYENSETRAAALGGAAAAPSSHHAPAASTPLIDPVAAHGTVEAQRRAVLGHPGPASPGSVPLLGSLTATAGIRVPGGTEADVFGGLISPPGSVPGAPGFLGQLYSPALAGPAPMALDAAEGEGPGPGSQGSALPRVPPLHSAWSALRLAVGDVLKPEVVEKLAMLLMVVAHEEAQRREGGEAEEEGRAAEGASPAAPALDDESLYAAQERLVLVEFRDTLAMVSRFISEKADRRARQNVASAAPGAAPAPARALPAASQQLSAQGQSATPEGAAALPEASAA